MARAETAGAAHDSASIKGLAQAIAKPAYRRLLTAEPALRRAVPALIIAFLLTIGVGAVVQVLDHRRQVIVDTGNDLRTIAEVMADRLDRVAGGHAGDRGPPAGHARARTPHRLDHLRPPRPGDQCGGHDHRTSRPHEHHIRGRKLLDLLGDAEALTILGASAGVLEISLAGGGTAFATVRALKPGGQLAVVQPRVDALATWRSDTALTITLTATTGFVLLILGFAFYWQAMRAREADLIYETVRSRVDTALNRGRCGLWDWDLARGRIFWSHSMFAILGLDAQDDLLTFGEVSDLVHPGGRAALRTRRAARRHPGRFHRPRFPHAACQRQMGVAARALRAACTSPASRDCT